MSLKNQKRLASEILKVGINRIWINPEKVDDVEAVITREEIRKLVHERTIRAIAKKGVSRSRARLLREKKKRGLRKGAGSKTGRSTARAPQKKLWANRIKAIRKRLKELRDRRVIPKKVYRQLYLMAKGGAFSSVRHIEQHITAKKLSRRR